MDQDSTLPMTSGDADITLASRAYGNWWKDAPKLFRDTFQLDWCTLIHFVTQLSIPEKDIVGWIPYLLERTLANTFIRTCDREGEVSLARAKEILDGLVGTVAPFKCSDFFSRKWRTPETLMQFMLDLKNMAIQLNLPNEAVKCQFLNGIPENLATELRREDIDDALTCDVIVKKAEQLLKFPRTPSSGTLSLIKDNQTIKLEEEIAALRTSLDQLKIRSLRCFKCGKVGHLMKNCSLK